MNAMKNEAEKLPEDVELLLPWHAAGTLSRRDAARVEQALANDNELASPLRNGPRRARRGDPPQRDAGCAVGARDAGAVRQDRRRAGAQAASFVQLGAWLTDFVTGFQPRTLAYGATAAALAIVLQAGILAGVFVKDGGVGFTTRVADTEQRWRLCRGPLQPAGQRRRHHQVPQRQQGHGRGRSNGRRAVQAARVR